MNANEEFLQAKRTEVLQEIRRLDVNVYENICRDNEFIHNLDKLKQASKTLKSPRVLDEAPSRLSSIKSRGTKVSLRASVFIEYLRRIGNMEEGESMIKLAAAPGQAPIEIPVEREVVAIMRTVLTLSQSANKGIHEAFRSVFDITISLGFSQGAPMEITKERLLSHLSVETDESYKSIVYTAFRDILSGADILNELQSHRSEDKGTN